MATQVKRQSNDSFFKAPRQFGNRTPNGFPIGPRTERRAKENKELNKLAIKECEIKLPGCLRTIFLSWAHSKKSRFIVNAKDWQEAARACAPCHNQLDSMTHPEMKRLVCAAIKRRKK